MRRLLRIFLTVFAGLSLLLCVAAAVFWVRSYGLSDAVAWRCAGGWRDVRSAEGRVVVGLLLANHSGQPAQFHGPRYTRDAAAPPHNWLMMMGGSAGDSLADRGWGGFEWHERRNAGRGTLHAIAVVPFWFVATVTAVPMLAWAAMWRRSRADDRRLASAGLCPACGYDLRATSERCPECGRAAAGEPAGHLPPTDPGSQER